MASAERRCSPAVDTDIDQRGAIRGEPSLPGAFGPGCIGMAAGRTPGNRDARDPDRVAGRGRLLVALAVIAVLVIAAVLLWWRARGEDTRSRLRDAGTPNLGDSFELLGHAEAGTLDCLISCDDYRSIAVYSTDLGENAACKQALADLADSGPGSFIGATGAAGCRFRVRLDEGTTQAFLDAQAAQSVDFAPTEVRDIVQEQAPSDDTILWITASSGAE